MKDLVEASPLREEEPAAPPRWLLDIIDEASKGYGAGASAYAEQPVLAAHCPLDSRASAYTRRGIDWVRSHPEDMTRRDPGDPLSIVRYFSLYISSKVHRAIAGLANYEDGGLGHPADHDGSAKAALLAVERSQAAWQALVDSGRVSLSTARPFIADLDWLRREIETVFPKCRSSTGREEWLL